METRKVSRTPQAETGQQGRRQVSWQHWGSRCLPGHLGLRDRCRWRSEARARAWSRSSQVQVLSLVCCCLEMVGYSQSHCDDKLGTVFNRKPNSRRQHDSTRQHTVHNTPPPAAPRCHQLYIVNSFSGHCTFGTGVHQAIIYRVNIKLYSVLFYKHVQLSMNILMPSRSSLSIHSYFI